MTTSKVVHVISSFFKYFTSTINYFFLTPHYSEWHHGSLFLFRPRRPFKSKIKLYSTKTLGGWCLAWWFSPWLGPWVPRRSAWVWCPALSPLPANADRGGSSDGSSDWVPPLETWIEFLAPHSRPSQLCSLQVSGEWISGWGLLLLSFEKKKCKFKQSNWFYIKITS